MLNLGFIGVGGYGRYQLEGFLPLQAAGRLRIRALADPSASALEEARALPGFASAEVYADYRALLDEAEIDAVVICAPIPAHKEITLRALRRNLFILLEKPPVPLLSDLRDLIAADHARRVMVGFQYIYRPLVQRMKRAAWTGEIGRVVAVATYGLWPRATEYYERSPWAGLLFRGGCATLDGPCTNAMAHFLNSLFFIAAEHPEHFAKPDRLEGEVYRARPMESYDVGALRGHLDNGVSFSASFAHASAETMPVRIVTRGTRGQLELLDNARRYRDSRGNVFEGEDGREELRLAFLDFAEGDARRNLTSLRACLPYVLATNLMFQSSGGIGTIDGAYFELLQAEASGAVYSVPGLGDLFASCAERPRSFASAGVPWAIPPRPLSASDFDEREMLGFLTEEKLSV